ncbi:MAG: UvrD-helicase domain-containing protein [Myxococcales bacterium]|nr:UvrD-helicase domain-containing protein [Myxococcales bacterium]
MLDLSTLNREQLEAVLTTQGPVLVLAGAGSGKTRVITFRLAYLIREGVRAKNILAVTFTNKAAFEMRERAKALAGKGVRGATISTFHALGSRILRTFPEKVGLQKGFTITDGGEQIGSLRRILRNLRIDDRRFDAGAIMAVISQAKNAGMDAARFRAAGGDLGAHHVPGFDADKDWDEEYRVAAIEAYDKYEAMLKAQNLVDFDDLLLLTLRLLQDDAEVRGALQHKWHYLMIDEYQDTNGAQLELMRVLAGAKQNLCAVGDDDQSIYGWRGADITNILSFETHFEGAKVIKLETNYRSTGNILEVANAIIEKNTDRYGKRLRPHAGQGDPVKLVAMEDEDAEAEEVARAVLGLIATNTKLSDIAVLYRSNVQSRPIELAFRTAQIRYRVVGGMDLFDKKEIKDALAYLKYLNNPEDEQALRRILNYPPRGIGDTTIKKIDDWARQRHMPFGDALKHVGDVPGIPDKAEDAVLAFLELITQHRKFLKRQKASTVAKKLITEVGLEAAVFASTDNASGAARKVDNVREIVRQIERYEQRVKKTAKRRAHEEELDRALDVDDEASDDDDGDELELEELIDPEAHASLEGFLSDLLLSGWEDGETSKEDRDEMLVLSTIHASKGLEWPHVFLVGVEEELLPHRRTLAGEGDVAEERRLAYVAVTRAREQLTVSYAKSRTRYGKIVPTTRSRFLEELPEDALERREGDMRPERTEEEKKAIELDWRAKIRAQLGIE